VRSGKGDLTYRIRISSGDEFEDLAGSFNAMAEELRQNIETLKKTTAEKERYAKEMEIARGIQTSFLPASMPDLPGYDISAVMIPAMEVGGDFYDVVPLAGGRWAFVHCRCVRERRERCALYGNVEDAAPGESRRGNGRCGGAQNNKPDDCSKRPFVHVRLRFLWQFLTRCSGHSSASVRAIIRRSM